MTFRPIHPKWSQILQLTAASETTSILVTLICESPLQPRMSPSEKSINEVTWYARVWTPAGWGRRTEKDLNHWIFKNVKVNFTAYMFLSWVILHSYLINEPLVGFTNITRETFLWETNGQGTRNGGIIKEQLLSDLPQIGQVSGKFVKKIFILLVQCCMQRTTSRSTALMVELLSNHPPSSFILKYPVLSRLSTGQPKIEPYLHRPPTQHVLPFLNLFDGEYFYSMSQLTVSHTDGARVRMKTGNFNLKTSGIFNSY